MGHPTLIFCAAPCPQGPCAGYDRRMRANSGSIRFPFRGFDGAVFPAGVFPSFRIAALVVASTSVMGMAGCGASLTSATGSVGEPAAITGTVHGGQQPVSGATISLVEPGTTGYGSSGSVIVSTTSASDGTFTLPRPYTCPANSGLVYLTAKGGNAGGGSNSAIGLAAVLGPCSGLSAGTTVNINEATTVAAAYVLAPFATLGSGSVTIGTSATNLQGLNNAAGAAANLVSTTSGSAHVTADLVGIVPPTAEIDTLADILAACVNQSVGTVPASTCTSLFTAAAPPGGFVPTDTLQAAVAIAQNPGNNTAALYALAGAIAPFQPTLSSAPSDFSVALGYNGGAITLGGGTIGLAIDASGDAWVTTGLNSSTVHVLTEISPAGTYLSGSTVAATTGFGSTSLSAPIGLAIGAAGSLYVVDNSAGDVVRFSSSGVFQSTLTAASLDFPNGIALDGASDAWISNFGSTNLTEVNGSGVEAANSPYAVGSAGVDVAIDPAAVWVAGYSSNGDIGRIDLSTFAVTIVSTGTNNAGAATDHNNNVWIATNGFGQLSEFSNAGVYSYPPGNNTADESTVPQNVAVDGLGRIFCGTYLYPFVSNSMGTLMEYTTAGNLISPAVGYRGSYVIPVVPEVPGGIGIDGSGNVWIAGTNNGLAFPNYVAEVIGIAAPLTTPLSVAVKNNVVGVRP